MRHQWPEMQHPGRIHVNAVKLRNPGHIDERMDAPSHAPLEFEDQIRRTGDDACFLAPSVQNAQGFINGVSLNVFVPHGVIRF